MGRLGPKEERFRLADGIGRCLRDVAAANPLLLVLDDIQWCDPESLHLLSNLASLPVELPLVVMSLLRDDYLGQSTSLADLLVLTFTEPESYEYVCVSHQLVMKGTMKVQDADAERPMVQAAYDQLAGEQFAAVVAEGETAIEEHAEAIVAEREDGTSLWQVSAGVGGESHSRVMRFLPETIEIGIGDAVRRVDRLPGEPHTVTFLGGEETPELVVIEPLPDGAPKLIFNNMVLFPQGDDVFDGTGYTNSGFLATPITNTDTYELTFTAAGEFDHVCVLHQGMEGKIIVS